MQQTLVSLRRFGSWWLKQFQGTTGLGKLMFGGVSLLMACCLASVVMSGFRSAGEAVGMVATRTATAAPTVPPTQTPTIAPSATLPPTITPTLAPSATPGPTDTSLPTLTPVPSATPIPPVDITGSGQTVTDPVVLPYTVSRIHFTHAGRRNFIVKAYGASGGDDLLVNTVGRYDGIRPINAEEPVYFEVQADGKWSIHIEGIGSEPAAAQLQGTGDYASGTFMPERTGPVPYVFKHTGQRNFIVHLYCAGGSDIAQNEIGPVENQAVVQMREGPCFWDVQSDGEWALGPK